MTLPENLTPSPAHLVEGLPPALWGRDLCRATAPVRWLWHGYLAAGGVTLLTSQWKSGKTTLLSVLLARLKGGGTLAGLPVTAGKAVVVSEENPSFWQQRHDKLDLGEHVCFLCQPFRGKPRPEQWRALIDHLSELHYRFGLALAAIDTLASFLPGRDENSAAAVMEALAPLQQLTALGLGVLLCHHPRKGESAAGQSARGTGALSGFADVLIEMGWYRRGSEEDRRRRLRAWSRHDETPRQLVLELTPDGTDYVAHGDFEDESFGWGWPLAERVLEEANRKLTRDGVLGAWPEGHERPAANTLWRWLERAVAQGRLCRDGTGVCADPFRYWLPGQEELWRLDPFHPETFQLEPLADEELLRRTKAKLKAKRRSNRGTGDAGT